MDVVVDDQRIARMRGTRRGILLLGLPDGRCCSPSLFVGFARLPPCEDLLDAPQIDLLCRDQGVEFRAGPQLVVFAEVGNRFVDGKGEFPVFKLSLQLFTSQTGALRLFFADESLDAAAGLCRLDDRQPVGFGRLVLLREDFDDVAVVQRLLDRYGAAVDLAA